MQYFRNFLALVVSASFALGCGGSEGPELYEVTGKVVQDGNPISNAMVTFIPDDSSQPQSTGYTDANGEFSLQTRTGGIGAVKGVHKVLITKTAGEGGPNTKEAYRKKYEGVYSGESRDPSGKGAAAPEEPENVIPEKFSSPDTTPLEIRVPDDTGDSLTLSVTN